MFAKFHGLSTVINFAKANRSVCIDHNVCKKKLDVAASDEAALFYHTVFLSQNFSLLVEQNPGYATSLIFRFFEKFWSGNR